MTLLLRRVEGLPQKEVARRLGISEKMVERHMTDSIKHLTKLFGRGRKPRVQTSNRAFEIGGSDVVDKPTG
jgi:RNA polymerase sigma-70 factor (ECF subfamily)